MIGGIFLNKTKSKRIFYFDALRTMAIIAVIVFHIFNDCNKLIVNEYTILSFNWIISDVMGNCFRFGVDLFLMLSGALSLGRVWDIKSFLGKRIPRIVLPFLFWGFILSLFMFVFTLFVPDLLGPIFKSHDIMGFLTYLYNSYMAKNTGFKQYWFFWMILGTYLIMPIFNKWLYNAELEEAEYFLVIWLVTCLFDSTLNIQFPIKLSYFAGPIGMVVLGYYLRHTKRKVFNNKYTGPILIAFSSILLIFASYLNSDATQFYVFDRYSILTAIEVAGIFLLFKNFHNFNINSRIIDKIEVPFKKFIFSIATYSYGIYLFHRVLLYISVKYMGKTVPYKPLIFILFIVALIGSWIVLMILNRVSYLNQVIGAK